MNKVVYILVIVALFSCKSNSVAQEKEETNMDKPKIEKPKFSDIVSSDDIVEPSTVYLTGTVMGVFKDKAICGRMYKATTTIRVNNVSKSGSSIVNLISAGQEITFGFLKGYAKDFGALQQKFGKNQNVSLVVRENLCENMNDTVYEIIRFEIK